MTASVKIAQLQLALQVPELHGLVSHRSHSSVRGQLQAFCVQRAGYGNFGVADIAVGTDLDPPVALSPLVRFVCRDCLA
ncbi:hypothetical protein D3C87_2022840 [compost metagenome]